MPASENLHKRRRPPDRRWHLLEQLQYLAQRCRAGWSSLTGRSYHRICALVGIVAGPQRQGRHNASMIGRPQAEARAISRGGAHDLHILYLERSTKLYEIDAVAHVGSHIEQVFSLAAGVSWIVGRCRRPKRVDEAGVLQQQIGRKV